MSSHRGETPLTGTPRGAPYSHRVIHTHTHTHTHTQGGSGKGNEMDPHLVSIASGILLSFYFLSSCSSSYPAYSLTFCSTSPCSTLCMRIARLVCCWRDRVRGMGTHSSDRNVDVQNECIGREKDGRRRVCARSYEWGYVYVLSLTVSVAHCCVVSPRGAAVPQLVPTPTPLSQSHLLSPDMIPHFHFSPSPPPH